VSRSAGSRANRRGEKPPSPEPLPSPAVDSHTHLDIAVGGEDRAPSDAEVDAEIEAAVAVGVPRLVQVGVDVDSSRWSAELAARHAAVLAAVALHPNEAGAGAADGQALDSALAEIDRLAALPRVRAVGETGLDRFRTGPDGWAAQEASFRAHIRIARSTASRWSSTTATPTTRSWGCSRTRALPSTPSSTASPATRRSRGPASNAAGCSPSPAR
jgi:TatD DNase family protein